MIDPQKMARIERQARAMRTAYIKDLVARTFPRRVRPQGATPAPRPS